MEQDADSQFLLGLQMVQQNHNRRVEELIREVEHWKRQTQQMKQQYDAVEQQSKDNIAKVTQQNNELRRLLTEKQQESQGLLEARNQALSQVAQLKAQANQLQQFKKTISQMVTDGDQNLNMQTLADGLAATSISGLHGIESPVTRVNYTMPPAIGASYQFAAPTSSTLPSSTLGGNGVPRGASPSLGRVTRDAEPSRSDEPLDAAAYYQQVKEILEPQAFREFAANIKRLNAGQQSVAETLRNVKEIFGEQRPFLFSQLQKLIHQAEDEARRQVEHDGAAYR